MAYEKGGPGVHKESRVLFFLIASFSSDLPPDPILPAPGAFSHFQHFDDGIDLVGVEAKSCAFSFGSSVHNEGKQVGGGFSCALLCHLLKHVKLASVHSRKLWIVLPVFFQKNHTFLSEIKILDGS